MLRYRELFRTRMVFKQQVTRLKNRILSCFSKYGISFDETTSDAFNVKGRAVLQRACSLLPVHTRESVMQLLAQHDGINRARNRRHPPLCQCPESGILRRDDSFRACLRRESALWACAGRCESLPAVGIC